MSWGKRAFSDSLLGAKSLDFLKKASQFIDAINEKIGLGVSWLTSLMVLTVVYSSIRELKQ